LTAQRIGERPWIQLSRATSRQRTFALAQKAALELI